MRRAQCALTNRLSFCLIIRFEFICSAPEQRKQSVYVGRSDNGRRHHKMWQNDTICECFIFCVQPKRIESNNEINNQKTKKKKQEYCARERVKHRKRRRRRRKSEKLLIK